MNKQDFLNELEVAKVEAIVADKVALEALYKVLLSSIYSHGVMKPGESHDPFKNRAFALIAGDTDNEKLGLNIKAWFEGVNALQEGFNKLSEFKTDKEIELIEVNEAI